MLAKSVIILFVSSTLLSPSYYINGFVISSLPSFGGMFKLAETKSVMYASSNEATTISETNNPKAGAEDPIECYLVNQDAVIEDGEKPRIICTSDPEETAWMEGLNREEMIKTEGVENLSGQCVEGHSLTGKPEWECEG
jgi:hypothetical protein